ncbi:hypothetical protein BV898_14831 [Hypsibius exemplaris]|uniref:Chitin-binding type-2 domain-containing protein n=1 Tax=Hypsibius exemplaris TaxID=2072580 RepID=A0A9X6N9D8_HYPEX|nr:hypothetical protein BV898_14831 [Hypsibius exemplaris]
MSFPNARIITVISILPVVLWLAGVNTQRLGAMQALEQMRSLKSTSAGDITKVMIDAIPGVAYPVLTEIPLTGFSCALVGQPGYYADQDAYCQVYRRCEIDGGMTSFLCPNRTLFNQITLVAADFYTYSNPRLFHFNGKFLEDAVTVPPTNFVEPPPSHRIPNNRFIQFPSVFQNTRPLTRVQLEDSLGLKDEHDDEASDMQFEFADSTVAPPQEPTKAPVTAAPSTTLARTTKRMEDVFNQQPISSPPRGTLFFPSERFALPMLESPPTRKIRPQDDHVDNQPSDSDTSSWSLPFSVHEPMAEVSFKTTDPPRPSAALMSTLPQANRLLSANPSILQQPQQPQPPVEQQQQQPKPIRNTFRILRPTHSASINPSFFPN